MHFPRFFSLGIAVLTAAATSCSTPPVTPPGNDAASTTDAIDDLARDTSAPDVMADTGIAPNDVPTADVPTGDAGLVGARPYNFHRPSGYDATQPTPLLILLHGYSATGPLQNAYFRFTQLSDARTFLYAYPDGTVDASGKRFWNATDACCNFGNIPVDDVAYVNAIIDDVSAHYNVDPHRIFIVGHSNGGFMSHRLACDLSNRVAGIVSLAGALWNDPTRCHPSAPVAVLEVHGDADGTIHYNGGPIGDIAGAPLYPSAHNTVAQWAVLNHCAASLTDTGMTLDLDSSLPGAETRLERYDGCTGGAVELWTIQGGGHIPTLQDNWGPSIYTFLMAHPKP